MEWGGELGIPDEPAVPLDGWLRRDRQGRRQPTLRDRRSACGGPGGPEGEDARRGKAIAIGELAADLQATEPRPDQEAWRCRAVEEQGHRDREVADEPIRRPLERPIRDAHGQVGAVPLQGRSGRQDRLELGPGACPCADHAARHRRSRGDRRDGDLGLGAIGGDRPAPGASVRIRVGRIDPEAVDRQSMDDLAEVDPPTVQANAELVLQSDEGTDGRIGRAGRRQGARERIAQAGGRRAGSDEGHRWMG